MKNSFITESHYEAVLNFIESKKSELSALEGDYFFHDENVYDHIMLVESEVRDRFDIDNYFIRTMALIHDLGKLKTGVPNKTGGMRYPGHETGFFIRETLDFLQLHEYHYDIIQLFVNHHHDGMHIHKIPPHMQAIYSKGFKELRNNDGTVNLPLLIKFAICDIRGAKRSNPNGIDTATKLINQIKLNFECNHQFLV